MKKQHPTPLQTTPELDALVSVNKPQLNMSQTGPSVPAFTVNLHRSSSNLPTTAMNPHAENTAVGVAA